MPPDIRPLLQAPNLDLLKLMTLMQQIRDDVCRITGVRGLPPEPKR